MFAATVAGTPQPSQITIRSSRLSSPFCGGFCGSLSCSRYRTDQRGQVHGQAKRPAIPRLESFLRNHGIAAMDLFVSFRLLVGHRRRQILWFGVTAHPTAVGSQIRSRKPAAGKDALVSHAVDRAAHFLVAQPWTDCIINMPGFNLRQAHVPQASLASRWAAISRLCANETDSCSF
jgi:hypothetical protein